MIGNWTLYFWHLVVLVFSPRGTAVPFAVAGLCVLLCDVHAQQPHATAGAKGVSGLWEQRPPVIEAHAHLNLSGLEHIRKIMAENGISMMVNLSGGSPGRGMQRAVRLAQKLSGRIVNFYNVDWSRAEEPDFGVVEAARLTMAVEQYGYRGLKISKHLGLGLRDRAGGLISVDDPRLDPLWERAGVLGVPVAIHTGDPRAFFEPLNHHNERWEELSVHPSWSFAREGFPSREDLLAARDRVLARHPRTTFICVHFGNNPEDIDSVDRLLDRYPNVMLDISARVGEIGRHAAPRVRELFIKHQDRILFGTDIGVSGGGLMLGSSGAVPPKLSDVKPFYDAHWLFLETSQRAIAHPAPIQGRWTVDAIDLPREVLGKLYVTNAQKWILSR